MPTAETLDAEIQNAISDAVTTGTESYTTADGRSVKKFSPKVLVEAVNMLQQQVGLASPRRGFSVGKIQRPV